MKSIAIMALLGLVSAEKFLGDEAPVWGDSLLIKEAKQMSDGDEKFARFKAFEERRKDGKDDYTHSGPLEFVVQNEEENKKQGEPKIAAVVPPPEAKPGQVPAALPQKKQVFYFEGEDMVKRDAMVQTHDDSALVQFDIVDKENAEYPFPHVHTENHEDVDPITREVVNPVKGYAQKPQSLAHNWDLVDKENAEYPFPHVHTENHEDVDPITREVVNIVKGYAQKPQSLAHNWDLVDKENAEYPFPHVHTESHEDVDPITREPVNILKGYVQQENGLKRVIAN